MGKTRSRTFDDKAIAEFCREHPAAMAEFHFNCSRATVTNACRKYNIVPIRSPNAKRAAMAQWATENQATIPQMQNAFKITQKTAMSICQEFGYNPPKVFEKEPPVPSSNFEILRFLWQGYRQTDIARAMGVSRQRIQQVQVSAQSAGLFGPNSILQLKDPEHTMLPVEVVPQREQTPPPPIRQDAGWTTPIAPPEPNLPPIIPGDKFHSLVPIKLDVVFDPSADTHSASLGTPDLPVQMVFQDWLDYPDFSQGPGQVVVDLEGSQEELQDSSI